MGKPGPRRNNKRARSPSVDSESEDQSPSPIVKKSKKDKNKLITSNMLPIDVPVPSSSLVS